MDLFSILGASLRRWYVTLLVVGVTGLLAFQSYKAVEPVYTGMVSLVVLPSLEQTLANSEDPENELAEDKNPYAGQGGSQFAVAVLKRNLNSTAFRERLDLEKNEAILAETANSQPILEITASASTPTNVRRLLDLVTAEASVVLNEFQETAGAPVETRYRTAPAVPPGTVEDITPSRLRTAGAIGVMGCAVAAGLATTLDLLLTRRRLRRLQKDAPADAGTAGAAGVVDPGAGPAPVTGGVPRTRAANGTTRSADTGRVILSSSTSGVPRSPRADGATLPTVVAGRSARVGHAGSGVVPVLDEPLRRRTGAGGVARPTAATPATPGTPVTSATPGEPGGPVTGRRSRGVPDEAALVAES